MSNRISVTPDTPLARPTRPSMLVRHWPLGAALSLFATVVAFYIVVTLKRDAGSAWHIVYALDDPYIHMAMAKHFAQDGVWGVGRFEPSSSSSSLLWTLLLAACYKIVGANEIIPLILNLGAGIGIIVLVYRLLLTYHRPGWWTFAVLSVVVFVAPLPALAFIGMEHTLQTLLVLAFVALSAHHLSRRGAVRWMQPQQAAQSTERPLLQLAAWVGLALTMTLVRYEGLFVVGVVAVLCLWRKRVVTGVLLGAAALLPVVLYGIISVANGWLWLPNSVYMKGHRPEFSLLGILSVFGYASYDGSPPPLDTPQLFVLAFVALTLFVVNYRRRADVWQPTQIMILIFLPTLFLHLQFAAARWFFRYEAYLIVLGIVCIARALYEVLPDPLPSLRRTALPQIIAVALLAFFALQPLTARAIGGLLNTRRATTNTYQQKVLMGDFLRRYYSGTHVALNDVGAANFYADIYCLDLWGIADSRIARKIADETYTPADVVAYTTQYGARVAIVYNPLYTSLKPGQPNLIPPSWIKVGSWTVFHPISVGDETQYFYAIDPRDAPALRAHLEEYSAALPDEVTQELYDLR